MPGAPLMKTKMVNIAAAPITALVMKPRSRPILCEVRQQRHEGPPRAPVRRQGFGQQAPGEQPGQPAIAGRDPEDRPPAAGFQQKPADGRRQDRRHPHHQHQPRHQPRGGKALGQVAHHGARDDSARRAAEGRDAPPSRQHRHVIGQRAADGGQGVDHHPDHQWQPPAEPVCQRALHQLPDGQADKPGGEGDLDTTALGAEFRLDRREGGQVHVDRDRPDRGQEAEQQR